MNGVFAERIVDIDIDKAWQYLSDLSKAHCYVPGIIDTKICTDTQQGVGTSRQVMSKVRPPMDETVVVWQEGQHIELKLHFGDNDAQGPFSRSFFSYSIEAAGDKTKIRNSMRYEMRWGIVGKALGGLLNKAFSSAVADVTLAQKIYYETGKPVTKEALKAAKLAS